MTQNNKTAILILTLALVFSYAQVIFTGHTLVAPLYYPHGVTADGTYGYAGRKPTNIFNVEMSSGIYGDWRPGSYFSVQPHFGYTIFKSSQTSSSVQGGDLSSWYANLTLTHQITDFLSYSLSAGHEIRAGVQSDAIEDSYVRPNINWNVIKDVTLQTSFSYEHGTVGGGQQASLLEKSYDWYGGGLSLAYSPMKEVRLSLNYRLTLRSSNVPSREYTQNMVGLQIAYTPQ